MFKPQTSLKEYSVRAGQGAAVGAVVSTGGLLAPVYGGVVAGLTSIGSDAALGNEINYKQAGVDALITTATAGLVKSAPKVPGRLPNYGTKAFFTGKHTQRQLLEEAINVGFDYNTKAVAGIVYGPFRPEDDSESTKQNQVYGPPSPSKTPNAPAQKKKEGRK